MGQSAQLVSVISEKQRTDMKPRAALKMPYKLKKTFSFHNLLQNVDFYLDFNIKVLFVQGFVLKL